MFASRKASIVLNIAKAHRVDGGRILESWHSSQDPLIFLSFSIPKFSSFNLMRIKLTRYPYLIVAEIFHNSS